MVGIFDPACELALPGERGGGGVSCTVVEAAVAGDAKLRATVSFKGCWHLFTNTHVMQCIVSRVPVQSLW
jgi:hypothetical protein